MAKGDMLMALMRNAGKDKVTKMLQKMTAGGPMPTDVLELKKMPGGGPMGSMINPELSKAEMGKEYEYGYGGMVSKKKKKSKKKK